MIGIFISLKKKIRKNLKSRHSLKKYFNNGQNLCRCGRLPG